METHTIVLLIISLLLLLLCQTSSSLYIFIVPWNGTSPSDPTTNLTSIYLDSVYSTIGTRPTTNTTMAPMIFISSSDIISPCTLRENVNITDSVVVFSDALPPLYQCNRHQYGKGAALARILFEKGAKGLVISAMDKYEDGRVIGFTPHLQIPVVVAAKSIIDYLLTNEAIIVGVGMSPVDHSELKLLNNLSNGYTAWVIIDAVLYSLLIILMGFAVYSECLRIRHKGKRYSHRIVMSIAALASAIASVLWLVVDPFGGKGLLWWYTSLAFYFHQGIFCIVNLLIVRMWVMFTFRARKTIKRYLSGVTYFLSLFALVVAITQGWFWHDAMIIEAYNAVQTVLFVLCGLGYVLFGKNFLVIFSRGGNASPDNKVLPAKIALFILVYVIITYSIIIISFFPPMGALFCALFVSMVAALLFFAIFLFLFFPKLGKIKKKPQSRKTTVTNSTFINMSEIRTSTEDKTNTT